MNTLKSLIQFVSFSNIFTALCAFTLSVFFSIISHTELSPVRLTVIFLGTMASYIAVQMIPQKSDKITNPKALWIRKNRVPLYALLSASLLGCIFSIKDLTQFELLNFSHLFILVLFYERIFIHEKELRSVPFLKAFLISYIWACVCVAPQLYLMPDPNFLLWVECFVFILALTIPFDIRDAEEDVFQHIKTFATNFSLMNVRRLCFILFISSQLMSIYYLPFSYVTVLFSTIFSVIYFYLLANSWPGQKESIFLYGFDGLIILKLALLYQA